MDKSKDYKADLNKIKSELFGGARAKVPPTGGLVIDSKGNLTRDRFSGQQPTLSKDKEELFNRRTRGPK